MSMVSIVKLRDQKRKQLPDDYVHCASFSDRWQPYAPVFDLKRHRMVDNNKFFSVPVSISRRRAQLPPPLLGQPGPFSLGQLGILEEVYKKAGFHDIQIRVVPTPLHMTSAVEFLRFAQESFRALHQMLAGMSSETERQDVWNEIEQQLKQFEGVAGFEGPCELIIGVGVK
jgi:hypothetical protein